MRVRLSPLALLSFSKKTVWEWPSGKARGFGLRIVGSNPTSQANDISSRITSLQAASLFPALRRVGQAVKSLGLHPGDHRFESDTRYSIDPVLLLAPVAKLADAPSSSLGGLVTRGGSNPLRRTTDKPVHIRPHRLPTPHPPSSLTFTD